MEIQLRVSRSDKIPDIQLRVSRSETLVIAPVGRYRCSPELGCARTPSRTSLCEELEPGGVFCNVSATH
jgi:hypothetical protein